MTTTVVCLTLRLLLAEDKPGFTVRPDRSADEDDWIVIVIDPWANRYDALRFLHQDLTDFKLDTLREAFDWPDGAVPVAWLEEVRPMSVPASLWLPEPAIVEGC